MQKGVLLLLSSAFFFALSTVFAKFVNINSSISGIEITFFRFLLGFFFISIIIFFKGIDLRPKVFRFIAYRAVLSTMAVLFFFSGVQFTSIINANMLNMTYPVFVFLSAPLINKEKASREGYFYLLLTLMGVYFITSPDLNSFNIGDLFSFLSAVVAGLAIPVLREARKTDDSLVILFYHMGIGCFICFFLMLPSFILPEGLVLVNLLVCAFASLLGQIFLTTAYVYINAMSGSLISSSRILFAGTMGVCIFGEPVTWGIISGGMLILASLFGTSGVWLKIKRALF